MPPELRREQERIRRTRYKGPKPPKKRATKKRSGKRIKSRLSFSKNIFYTRLVFDKGNKLSIDYRYQGPIIDNYR
jgi:Ni/Co efflux regulator RcnB